MVIAANGFRGTSRMCRIGLAAAIVAASAASAGASDYVHQCRSADGNFVMNDEDLQAFDVAQGRETGPSISYKVLRKTVLSKNEGYCIANRAPAGQRRYNYAATTYALHIRFRQGGQRIKTFMLCEMASSGLPAAYNCDRDVTTLNWTIGKTAAAPGGKRPGHAWFHNGSEVKIIATGGGGRRIVFVAPNAQLSDIGVGPGDVLFEGRRKGNRYVGRAFVYSRNCRAKSFGVRGRVQEGERRVVVSGRKPVRGRNCRTRYREDVSLIFNRR